MDLTRFLGAQKWLQVAEETSKEVSARSRPSPPKAPSRLTTLLSSFPPQELTKIFEGNASFHVSLEENYKDRSAKDLRELKGALAPDALFIKLRTTGRPSNSLEIPCALYASASVGQDGESSSVGGAGIAIELKGKLHLLNRREIRYIVSSHPKTPPSRSPGKGKQSTIASKSSPRKRQRVGSHRAASLIFEGITLNLVETRSDLDTIEQLTSKLMVAEGGERDPFRRRIGGDASDARPEELAESALKKWLDGMDLAIDAVEGGKPDAEGASLNALASLFADHREAVLLLSSGAQEGDLAERQSQEEWEATFESMEGDSEKTATFLRDYVGLQKEREAAKHGLLIKSLVSL